MKPPSFRSLLLLSSLFTPALCAQDEPTKIHEIEQKVLRKQYQDAISALVGSAGDSGTGADAIGRRTQWLGLLVSQIDAGNQAPAPARKEMTESAGTLNDLAWRMVVSPDAAARHPEIALKLADLAIELGGGDGGLKPKLLDTRARALFLLGKHEDAIAGQEKAIATAVIAEEKTGLEATLAAYRKGELPAVDRPADQTAEALVGVPYIQSKLNGIVIPRVDFEDTSVEEAIDFLRRRATELDITEPDPARKGVNLVIRRPRSGTGGAVDAGTTPTAPNAETSAQGTASDPGSLRIKELRLRNVPLAVALKYICEQAKLRYKVDDFAVTLIPQTEADKDFFTRTFQVPPDFASSLNLDSEVESTPGRPPIIELLRSAGIHFGEGSSVTLASSGVLIVTNTPSELDKLEQLIQAMTITDVDRGGRTGKETSDPSDAQVKRLTDEKSQVSAKVEGTSETGILSGQRGNAQGPPMLRLRFLSKDAEVRKGQRVFSTGRGGSIPADLLLGTIESVEKGPLASEAVVRPVTESVDPENSGPSPAALVLPEVRDLERLINASLALIEKENSGKPARIREIDSKVENLRKQMEEPGIDEPAKQALFQEWQAQQAKGIALDRDRLEELQRATRSLDQRNKDVESALTGEARKNRRDLAEKTRDLRNLLKQMEEPGLSDAEKQTRSLEFQTRFLEWQAQRQGDKEEPASKTPEPPQK